MFILLSPDAGGPTARAHAGSGASATPPRKVQVQLRRLEGTDRGLFRPLARLCATTHQLCADQAEGEPVSSKREELADALARVAIAPEQLPVGVITALVGVPTFLYLLHRSR